MILAGAALFLNLCQLFVLPLALLPLDVAWGWSLVALALLNNSFWSILHEAIHAKLHRSARVNAAFGRALAVVYGAPYALLETGHLLHHRYSRTPRERTEVYDPARASWTRVAPAYYARLLGGLYMMEAASVTLALLPARVVRALARRADRPGTALGLLLARIASQERLAQFRIDSLAIVVLYSVAFCVYGAYAWMLAAALAARALFVSLADNSYHYGTSLESPAEALDLRLPAALEISMLAFNLHGMHHREPGADWRALRARFRAEGCQCDVSWFVAVARQLRGPIAASELASGPDGRRAGKA
jgi:fatty acid desaturase